MTINYLLRWLCIFTLALLVQSKAVSASETVLLLGDSLSAAYGIPKEKGWAALLQERLRAREMVLVNISISGETSSGGLQRLPAALRQHQPDWMILELGGNDGLRGISIETFRQNMQKMVKMAVGHGIGVLVLGMKIPPNYGAAYTREFEKVYQDLATLEGVELVPFFLQDVAIDYDLMQADGIHPTADAQPVLLNNVWPLLESMIGNP